MSPPNYRVPAVVTAAAVLRELSERPDGATQTELARAVKASKSTMHNMLATLEAERFVRRDPRTRTYQLGPALISLGTVAEQQIKAVQLAAEALAPLAAGEGLSFAIAHHTAEGTAQVIERFYPPRDVHVGVTLGARFGRFEGALGKCLLAALEPDECERMIRGRSLPAHTERSITETEEMLAEIESVRERGWAVSAQELNEVNAVAAPVFGANGEPVLYLLALGLVDQLREDGLDELGAKLHDLAEEMTLRSGGASPVASPTAG